MTSVAARLMADSRDIFTFLVTTVVTVRILGVINR